MRHDFSPAFLKIVPPSTNFGEAWEALCYELLRAEKGAEGFVRLAPPDRGIDILHRPAKRAYQCKASEQGALGTLGADDSIISLRTAVDHRAAFGWDSYCFATNAPYTGIAYEKVMAEAQSKSLTANQVEFLGPEHWDDLCIKHHELVKHRFDYKVSVSEKEVIEAFRTARYYPGNVAEFEEKIRKANFKLIITNNRTPLEIEIPFSPEFTVKNYLDVAKALLCVSLEWTNYPQLGTSAGPSLSITINQHAKPFDTKIAELPIQSGDKLEFWIKLVWKDELESKERASREVMHFMLRELARLERGKLDQRTRRGETLKLEERLIQAVIWQSGRNLSERRLPT